MEIVIVFSHPIIFSIDHILYSLNWIRESSGWIDSDINRFLLLTKYYAAHAHGGKIKGVVEKTEFILLLSQG